MKKLLLSFLLLLTAACAFAQPQITPSQLAPHEGFTRKSPCASSAGDGCGSNPPTWHITPAQCGILFSTSSARNEDTSFSTAGIRFTLPTAAEFATAGYTSSGASPLSVSNREGQCRIGFVTAAPLPTNYLSIGIDGGVSGTDKLTHLGEGNSFDAFSGDMKPNIGYGTMWFYWNGTSWLTEASPAHATRFNQGQIPAHGQGRMFLVTADPSWWTVTTSVGKIAYCPNHGRGLAVNANSHDILMLTPTNCAFTSLSGSTTQYLQIQAGTGVTISAIAAGAAYIAGTAPNGTAYLAGNYVRATISGIASANLTDGDTVTIWNVPTTLGSVVNGKWIVEVVDSTHIDLHEAVYDWDHERDADSTGVGPPSSYVATDTILGGNTSRAAMTYIGLSGASATGAATDASQGVEFLGNTNSTTLVGIAKDLAGVITDSGATREVASLFNPVEKKCEFNLSGNKTTTSLTFVEADATRRCSFVYIPGVATKATSLGDLGRRVRYTATVRSSNNTALDGCEYAIGFDGTTAEESSPPGFTNPTGITDGQHTITVAGNKSGLSIGLHNARLLHRAVTGGTCTTYATGTTVMFWIWQ